MIRALPVRKPLPFFAIGFAIGLTICSVILVTLMRYFGAYAGAGVVVLLLVVLGVRWPTATAVTFIAFTPVNRFVIMVVYHYSHSLVLTKGVELWKEAILGAILVRVL